MLSTTTVFIVACCQMLGRNICLWEAYQLIPSMKFEDGPGLELLTGSTESGQ